MSRSKLENREIIIHKKIEDKSDLKEEFNKKNEALENANLVKSEFREWLKNEGRSQSATSTYPNTLEKLCFELIGLDIENKNLFFITDKDEFEECEKKIRSTKNFKEINNRPDSSRAFSAAMRKYKEFLEYKESIKNSNTYSKKEFLKEVFINDDEYETIKELLKRKKNIILQGAPGVGKTFVAKRLAYSIMGEKNKDRVKMVQFHQSYSYEDFVMGYRPNENGFKLKEGPFYEFCIKASKEQDKDFYFIIDEINRGNMSKIFGELLMLIENDKRGESLTLTYSDKEFYVPSNLYIIGMMNTADRSLAIIDYALRRRFCFIELNPAFDNYLFREKLLLEGASDSLVNKIISRIGNLNKEIENDKTLGKGFRIGHSYFCNYENNKNWYDDIIKYEIDPLLREYWFDEEEKAESYIDYLLRG